MPFDALAPSLTGVTLFIFLLTSALALDIAIYDDLISVPVAVSTSLT